MQGFDGIDISPAKILGTHLLNGYREDKFCINHLCVSELLDVFSYPTILYLVLKPSPVSKVAKQCRCCPKRCDLNELVARRRSAGLRNPIRL